MPKRDIEIHYAAATILGLATGVHLLRAVNGWPLILGTWAVPMWISWALIVIAGYLCFSLWRVASR